MELVNIYPIFSDSFLSNGRGKLSEDRLPRNVKFDYSKLEHPNALQSIYKERCVSCVASIPNIRNARLIYFSDGIFAVETQNVGVSAKFRIDSLINIADSEREEIERWLLEGSSVNLLSSIEQAYHPEITGTIDYKLGFAYSHNFFLQERTTPPKELLSSNQWVAGRSDFIADIWSNPAVNLVVPHHKGRMVALSALRNITIILASMYRIQEDCVSMSRVIVEDTLSKNNLNFSVEDAERKLGLFQQFLNEVRMVDFLSDPFEEVLGKTIASNWDWKEVCDRAVGFTGHLSSQIEKLNDKISRRSDRRVNAILFSFTFITVLDVSANMFSFYDLDNSVVPVFRIFYIISVFILALASVKIYLSRGDHRRK